MVKLYSIRIYVCLICCLLTSVAFAQINSTPAVVPFNSNPGYGTNGMMPGTLPSGGAYGKSSDAANAYNSWKSEFREACSGKGARIRFDNASETVSEGIGYGMLLAAYAGDKAFFDDLYTYWRAYLSNNGLMNWKINGCGGTIGNGSATDADFDAAYAMLVAKNQWPSATSPFNYTNEFNTMIGRIKQFDMANNGRATNGDGWFQNDCSNPGYHSPGYYQAFATANTANATFWSNTAYNFAYDVLWTNNAHATTGLVSNWSSSSGTPNQCNAAGNGQVEAVGFGYDASRYPWRIAQDVLWNNSTKGRVYANKMTNYLRGRGVNNIGGPLNLNGTNGSGYQQNATFISMLTLATMAADNNPTNQAFLDAMYTRTVNSLSGDGYFGKTLRVISLFMLSGNFWKIGTTSNQEINIRATGIKVGAGAVTPTNLNIEHDGTYDFQNTQTSAGNPSGKTATFTIENRGFQNLNLTGTPRVVVSGTDAAMFTVVQPSASTLALNASTTFTVQFIPASVGVKTAKLTIASNDSDEPAFTINLTGLGTLNQANSNIVISQYNNTAVACGSTLAFGNATTGAFATKVLKIKNTGDGALNLSTYTYSNARFSTVGVAPTSVAVNDSAILVIQFNPNAASAFTGTLTIVNNDPTKGSCVINLTGTGVACTSTGNILQDFDNNNNLVQKTGNVNTTFTFNEPNPFITAQNPSGNVGKLVIPAAAGAYSKAIVFTPCAGAGQLINYTGRKTVTMLIYSTAPGIPISVSLKNLAGFSDPWAAIAAGNFTTTKTAQWEKIVMDFGAASGGVWDPLTDAEANTTSFIEININNAVANGATPLTYYIDEIKFEDNPCIAGIPATKILNDFDNNQFVGLAYTNATSNLTVMANPSMTGINTSSNVARHSRVAGTGVPATDNFDNGLRFSGCNNNIDLSINDGVISFMVYTPVAGLPVTINIMKADDGITTDADDYPDQVATASTVAALPNTWQKVYFDFGAHKANTTIIALDVFIDPLRTKGVQTYYIDNLMYDVMPNCTADIAASGILMDFDANRNLVKVHPGPPEFDDVAANPTMVGNTSALAGKLLRAATSQYASSIRYAACGTNFKFESGKNKLELLVYSPQAGVTVQIDMKDALGVSVGQVNQLTTVANAWEKLIFDFSDITNITTATLLDIFIDPTAEFVSSVATRTYYIDVLRYSTVVGPEISVYNDLLMMPNASTQNFGTVLVGDSSDVLSYSIKNYGSALLTLNAAPADLVISGPNAADFIITKNPSYVTSISSNSATNFLIYFKPSTGGLKTATLTIENNDSDENPYIITLTGTATSPTAPEINVKAGAVTVLDGGTFDFGSSNVGTATTATTFTIENLGTAVLTISGTPKVAISGINAADYTIVETTTTATVAEAASTTFTISFNPAAVGASTAAISIANDDTDENPYIINLTGTGVCPLPGAAGTITGLASVCSGQADVIYSIAAVANATGYDWTVPADATISGGDNTTSITVTFGSTIGDVTVTPTSACGDGISSSITVTPEANPASVSIIASSSTICAGTSVTFTATPTNGGTTPVYQWKVGTTSVGTGGDTYSTSSLADNEVVTVVMTSSLSCSGSATSNAITMDVALSAAASVSIAASTSSICAGTSVTFTATPVNGGTPTYQWKVGTTNVGTGGATYTSTTLADNDVVTVVMTSNASCVSGSPATSNAVTMEVTPAGTASVSIAASTTTPCAGESVTFTATPVNGGTPTYQWKVGTTNVGTSTATYTSTTLADNEVVTVEMTSSLSCATGSPTTSNAITMDVAPTAPASVSIAASTTTICTGESVTFTATPVNGGTPTYQWKVGTTNVGTGTDTYTSTTLADGDVVTVEMTSNASCVSGSPATSNDITMTVAPAAPASVSIVASSSSICTGTSVTFTATPVNGGTTPTYQWKVGTTDAGTGTDTYTSATLADGDVVTVVMTSNALCVSGSPATSNAVTMEVTPAGTASVSIAANTTTTCTGGSVTFTATPVNGGTPTYQWKIGTTDVGTGGATFTTTSLLDGDVVTVEMTSSLSCATGSPATSNAITMDVAPTAPASVSLAASSSTICTGESVTFTATPVNGGTTPTYQWKVGTTDVGTGTDTYTSTTLADGDVVTVIMTSNASCISGSPATSNPITMTVAPAAPASVSIAASSSSICTGTSVTFTATPVNGGTTPTYQWKVGTTDVGAGTDTYTSATLADGDVVTVVMTSNASCVSGSPATSNAVTMEVTPAGTASVSIAASTTTTCTGGSVTFTATPVNGGTPTYQWKIGTTDVGTGGATFTTTSLLDGDVVTVEMTSSLSCATGSPATSNAIAMTVGSGAVASVSIAASSASICPGESVTFTATPVNEGATPTYQWKVGTTNVGTGTDTYTSTTLADGDVVTVEMTSSLSCAAGSPATSNAITMSVTSGAPASVSIAASSSSICTGTSVTFTATPVNGGTTPTYQWKVGTTDVGTGTDTYTSATLADGDVVTVVMTSNALCVSGSPATSDAVTMEVTPAGTASVSIAANTTTTCTGGSVTFTATPVNGGTPTYQWKIGTTDVGTGGATFTTTSLLDGDVVTVEMISSLSCATGSPATSNAIAMTVGSGAVASVSITASTTTTCTGGSVTFTATPVNGGTPTYQWKIGTTDVGTGGATLTTTSLLDGDVVTVEMTSSLSCATGSPATSNAIAMTVGSGAVASVSIAASSASICPGESVTFTATPVNEGATPTYQWKVGTTNVGTGTDTYTSTTLADGDVVTVEMTSSLSCAAGSPATSNAITMDVTSGGGTANVSIAASPSSTVCVGTAVTFTATATNGGASPVYQWKIGSTNAGIGATFTTSTLANADLVTCEMTSNSSCAAGTFTSNAITMTVNARPTVTASSAVSMVCSGNSTTLTATPAGGTGPYTYAWTPAASLSPATSATPSATPTANTAYSVIATDFNGCSSTAGIVMVFWSSSQTASVSISSPDMMCANTTTTFNATPIAGGGASPAYQWRVDGINQAGETNASFTTLGLAPGSTVTCVMTSSSSCATGSPATSNSMTVVANGVSPCTAPTAKTISGPTSVNAGQTATYTVPPAESGSIYNWAIPAGSTITSASADSSSITITFGSTSGNIVVTETNGLGSVTNPSLAVTVDGSTGIGNKSLSSLLEVNPNPSYGKFTVTYHTTFHGQALMNVRNALGEVVYSTAISQAGATSDIDLQELPGGVYFLEIKTEQGVAIKRIVKQ